MITIIKCGTLTHSYCIFNQSLSLFPLGELNRSVFTNILTPWFQFFLFEEGKREVQLFSPQHLLFFIFSCLRCLFPFLYFLFLSELFAIDLLRCCVWHLCCRTVKDNKWRVKQVNTGERRKRGEERERQSPIFRLFLLLLLLNCRSIDSRVAAVLRFQSSAVDVQRLSDQDDHHYHHCHQKAQKTFTTLENLLQNLLMMPGRSGGSSVYQLAP